MAESAGQALAQYRCQRTEDDRTYARRYRPRCSHRMMTEGGERRCDQGYEHHRNACKRYRRRAAGDAREERKLCVERHATEEIGERHRKRRCDAERGDRRPRA